MPFKQFVGLVIILLIFIGGYYGYFIYRQRLIKEEVIDQIEETKEPELIEVVAENLGIPWEIVFLPNSTILVTERPGTLAIIKNGEINRVKIPGVHRIGEGGLLGMAPHPNFESNKFLYLYLTYSEEGQIKNKVERYKIENDILSERTTIIDNIPGSVVHNGGRIAFGPDQKLYITTGDATQPPLAQDINSLAGKILRLNDDGSVPEDNPFLNYVWSYGHRNPQGLAWDNQGGLFATEHGPSGGFWPNCCQDEINLVEKGKNYGWPDSVGDKVQSGTVAPLLHSGKETWAPGGATFFNGSLFFGGLKGQALFEVKILDENITSFKPYFLKRFGRIRTVVLGSDNFLYIATSNTDGRGVPKIKDDKIIKINIAVVNN